MFTIRNMLANLLAIPIFTAPPHHGYGRTRNIIRYRATGRRKFNTSQEQARRVRQQGRIVARRTLLDALIRTFCHHHWFATCEFERRLLEEGADA